LPFETSENKKLISAGLMLMRHAIRRHGFLDKNSRVLVGISGGIDSLVLLTLLIEYNKQYQQGWEIHACHIHPQFPQWNVHVVEKFLKKYNVPYTIVTIDINKDIKQRTHKCYLCSRERRRKLLEVADSLSTFQIALAHHKEDAAETILLNMMYNAEISTLVPKQSVIQGRFFFIRPLYYFEKETINKIVQVFKLPQNKNICPYFEESKRETVREFLTKLQRYNPDVYKNIFRSIFTIKNSYMPH
jgi:tRNA 2-thiocytidine biosynthesis protein TtcA